MINFGKNSTCKLTVMMHRLSYESIQVEHRKCANRIADQYQEQDDD